MRSLRIMLTVVAGSLLLCSPAGGDLSFTFEVSESNLTVSPGQSKDISVFLQEAVTGDDVSLLVAEDGLSSAGVLVERTGSSGSDPAVITDASANGAFDDPFGATIVVAGHEASIFEMRDFFDWAADPQVGSGVPGTVISSGVRRILLGTFTITAGGTVGEVSTFLVHDNDFVDDTLTWTFPGTLLDDYPIGFTSFTVETVPLPSAVLLCAGGMSVSGALLRRRGVRHSSAAA